MDRKKKLREIESSPAVQACFAAIHASDKFTAEAAHKAFAHIKPHGDTIESLTAERDTLKALCVEWKPIDSAPKDGVFLVYLEKEMLGSRVHTARWHPNVKIIGGVFSFDAPNPTHWMPLPPSPTTPPPCGSEGKPK